MACCPLRRGSDHIMAGHEIRLTLSRYPSAVNALFVCLEDPPAECQHRQQCLLAADLNDLNSDWQARYHGPATEVRSGLIEIAWNGDEYMWKYQGEQP